MSISITMAIMAIAIVIAMAIWWLFPKFQLKTLGYIPSGREKAELENDFRKTVAQPMGAVLLLASALTAYYQFLIDYDAKQQSSALSLMSKDSLLERMAGIELLKEWASRKLASEGDQEKRKKFLKTALLSFLRGRWEYKLVVTHVKCGSKADEYAPWAENKNFALNKRRQLTKIGADAQAVLDVLLDTTSEQGLDLFSKQQGSDFSSEQQGLELCSAQQGLDLSQLWLSGAKIKNVKAVCINLSFSDLKGADFTGSTLKNPDFFCTNLSSAIFEKTELLGGRVNEDGNQVNMVSAVASYAIFTEAKLQHVNMQNAYLDTPDVKFSTWTNINASQANFINFDFASPQKVEGEFKEACLFDAKNWNQISGSTKDPITEEGDLREALWCRKHLY